VLKHLRRQGTPVGAHKRPPEFRPPPAKARAEVLNTICYHIIYYTIIKYNVVARQSPRRPRSRGSSSIWHSEPGYDFRTSSVCIDLTLCASSLRRGHANLFCIVPSLTHDLRRESKELLVLCYVEVTTLSCRSLSSRPRVARSTPARRVEESLFKKLPADASQRAMRGNLPRTGEFSIISRTVMYKHRFKTLTQRLNTLNVYRCLDVTVRDIIAGSPCKVLLRGRSGPREDLRLRRAAGHARRALCGGS